MSYSKLTSVASLAVCLLLVAAPVSASSGPLDPLRDRGDGRGEAGMTSSVTVPIFLLTYGRSLVRIDFSWSRLGQGGGSRARGLLVNPIGRGDGARRARAGYRLLFYRLFAIAAGSQRDAVEPE